MARTRAIALLLLLSAGFMAWFTWQTPKYASSRGVGPRPGLQLQTAQTGAEFEAVLNPANLEEPSTLRREDLIAHYRSRHLLPDFAFIFCYAGLFCLLAGGSLRRVVIAMTLIAAAADGTENYRILEAFNRKVVDDATALHIRSAALLKWRLIGLLVAILVAQALLNFRARIRASRRPGC